MKTRKTAKGIEIHDVPEAVDEDGFECLTPNTRRDVRVWPWERPQNWRTGENYPEPGKASRNRWAFEFLRRNVDFLEELEALSRDGQSLEDAIRRGALGDDLETQFQHPFYRARREFFSRWGIRDAVPCSLFELGDPRAPDAPFEFETGTVYAPHSATLKPGFASAAGGEEVFIFEARKSDCPIVFNLSWPLAPQLKRARDWLEAQQGANAANRRDPVAKAVRLRDKVYPKYLRAWDAKVSKAKEGEILKVLGGELAEKGDPKQGMENALNAARALIGGGYRFLPMATERAGSSARAKVRPPK